MRNRTMRLSDLGVMSAAVVFAACFSIFPTTAGAQGNPGQNAVCTSTTGCSTTVGTSAFIDASVFASPNTNFCAVIYNILNGSLLGKQGYPAVGAVVDARGLNSGNINMTCATGWTPWYNGATYVSAPANILLPAGTIVIPSGWTLPPNTHLFGQGDNPSSGTVIQAGSSFSGTAIMIQFGSSPCLTSGCPGISVEKLILDGQGRQSAGSYISGIVNQASVLSYVDHVSLGRSRKFGVLCPLNLLGLGVSSHYHAGVADYHLAVAGDVSRGRVLDQFGGGCAQALGGRQHRDGGAEATHADLLAHYHFE